MTTSSIDRAGRATPGRPEGESPAMAAAARDAAEFVARHRWAIMAGLITAAIMEVLDTTIVNVALPQMAGNLGATREEIGWVATGYILSNVIFLPMTAFLTERFGRRRYLTFSIVLFIVASFFCGNSTGLVELVFWRIVQGAGGAALLSTAQATIRQIFPLEQQGIVQAVFLLGLITAPTLGPTLGGWITDNYQWHWVFFINIPIGIVATFLVTTFLRDPPTMRRRGGAVDWLGIGLLTAGLGSLQYVLEEGNRKDWFSDPWILRLAIIGGVSLVGMVGWELWPRNRHPVVNFRVLVNAPLAASIFLFVALGFALYGGTFIFPLFTESVLHFTPTATGLALLPGGIGTAATALICGRLLNGAEPLVDARVLIAIGVVLLVWAMWRLGHLSVFAGEADVRWALLIRGAGLGLLFTPINNVAYASLEPSEAQQASGLINLARQLGGSFGIAWLASYVTTHTAIHRVDLVSNVYAGNPLTQQRLQAFMALLTSHGYGPVAARQGAYALLDRQVTAQASMLSYNDAWMLLLWSFVIVSPAILFLRNPVGRRSAPVDAH
ncbi:MAG TPA: DHA2 family efflux MFS transporter permease subunit [Gemmatimonadales bacterium]|nr:DHA2 family efflux MFS transporter permease subunit [Gemmatimonadales bacterium]